MSSTRCYIKKADIIRTYNEIDVKKNLNEEMHVNIIYMYM